MSFIGLGQYGGRQVDSFLALNSDLYTGFAVNTADSDLRGLMHVMPRDRFVLGNKNGAGRTPGVAYQALLDSAQEFFENVQRVSSDADQVWLVAGLGGGTGTGALLLLLEYIGDLFETPPGLILTVPREADGLVQTTNAVAALSKIQEAVEQGVVGAVLFMDNDRFYKQFAEDKRSGDWRDLSNSIVAQTLHDLNLLTDQAGITNFDKEDFRKVLSFPGCLAIASVGLSSLDYTGVSKQIEASLTKGFLSFGYRFEEAKVFATCFTLSEPGRNALLKTEAQRHIESHLISMFPHSVDRYFAYYEGDHNRVLSVAGGLGFPSRVLDMPSMINNVSQAETKRFEAPKTMDLGGLSSFIHPTVQKPMKKDNPFLGKTGDSQETNPFIKRPRNSLIKTKTD